MSNADWLKWQREVIREEAREEIESKENVQRDRK